MRGWLLAVLAAGLSAQDIPKAWDPHAVAGRLTMERPSPKFISADDYYKIPERVIYKTYPVYRPDKEPQNYIPFLSSQNPEIVFNPDAIKSEFDWLQAGEAVFNSAADATSLTPDDLRNPEVWKRFHLQVDEEGALPGWRYVIRKRAKIELAPTLCGSCHEGVANGVTYAGVPGKWRASALYATDLRRRLNSIRDREAAERRELDRQFGLFSVPWQSPEPAAWMAQLAIGELWSAYDAVRVGTAVRPGASLLFPPIIPDLIGVQERTLLGATGWFRHESLADLIRFAVLESGFDEGAPPPAERLSDAQAYALALFLYSLKAPKNPNRLDKFAKKGQAIFEREGCASCHPGPRYTTGKAIPPDGDDPRLTVRTRRGTGLFRIPSLRNIWYREPLEHNGMLTTIEDWFDPVRFRDDYSPRPVKGHAFGMKLSYEERQALAAYLRTL
ncbi:MAG: c-type cytochrome [Acidobacteria bacterium]|nr:c-type cytochrome [Acidobacteriota bacterium]